MKKLLTSRKIYVARSKITKAGRGVFAAQNIKRGDIIEVCPVILIPKNDVSNLKGSILINYYFYFGKKKDMLAIALGFGSIYNHSYEPSATYKKKTKGSVIEFVAIKNIKKGEEITVNYNFGDPKDKTRLWIPEVPPFKG
ncbi:MAG: SET domain-containing protein [bacterium]|nr:SET domain-containing protein [bacterium]